MHRFIFILLITFNLIACGQTNSSNQVVNTVDTSILTKEQKMDTTHFWKIMDYAFEKGKFDNKIKEQNILDRLIKLTPEQIGDFEIIFQQQVDKSNTWNNFAAHTIIEGGSTDDGFYYFRCWLISLGKHNFDKTLNSPDYLANLDIPINKKYGYGEVIFEELITLSDRAYSIVTKKAAEDETFPRATAHKKGLYFDSAGEMKGNEWTDIDLPKIAPKLYKKFNVK